MKSAIGRKLLRVLEPRPCGGGGWYAVRAESETP